MGQPKKRKDEYSGDFDDVMGEISEEIGDALKAADIPPSPLHSMAFANVLGLVLRNIKDKGGPSLETIFNIIRHQYAEPPGIPWTAEEWAKLEEDLQKAAEAMGGKMVRKTDVVPDTPEEPTLKSWRKVH